MFDLALLISYFSKRKQKKQLSKIKTAFAPMWGGIELKQIEERGQKRQQGFRM